MAEVGETHLRSGKKNARLRVIFDNGREGNNLLRSLARELYMSQRGKQNDKVYLTIVDGTLHTTVPEGTPGAVRREWEAGGKKGTKHEIIDRAIKGKIVDVLIYEGEYEDKKFTTLNVILDKDNDAERHPVISTTIEGRYAQDILQKPPIVNSNEEVRI